MFRTWLRSNVQPAANRAARRRQASLEAKAAKPAVLHLEDRTAPATFAQNAGDLDLVLDQANEAVSIVSNGATYTLTLNGANVWAGTDDAGKVVGNGTGTLTVTADVFAKINLDDAAAGTAATFANSGANAYADEFDVDLSGTAGSAGVTFTGASSFATNPLTVVTDRSILVSAGAAVSSSTGAISLTAQGTAAGGYIGVDVAGAVTSSDGNVTVQGTGAGTGSDKYGVRVTGTVSGGTGKTTAVTGTGGGDTSSNFGVFVFNTGLVSAAGSGVVMVDGTGGGGAAGILNTGVLVQAGTAKISSGGGNVSVAGQGGQGDGSRGVQTFDAATITAGGSGTVTVAGTGGGTSGAGVRMSGAGGTITSNNGTVSVTGVGVGAPGIEIAGSGNSISSGGNKDVTLTADTADITAGTVSAGTGTVTVLTKTAATVIDLGGADSPTTLGLTSAEVDTITAGQLVVGSAANTGGILVSQAIAPTGTTSLALVTNGAVTNGASGSLAEDALAITGKTGIGTSAAPQKVASAALTTDSSGGNAAQFLTSTGTAVLAGANAGTGTVTLSGGTFQANAANAIVGATPLIINAGTLEVTANGALGTTAAGTSVAGGATLKLSGVSYTDAEPLSLSDTANLTSTGTSSFAGQVTLPAGGSANVSPVSGSTLTLSGKVTGNGTLKTNDAGTVLFTGTTSDFARLNIAAGTAKLGADGSLPSGVDVSNASAFELNGKTQSIDAYAGAGATTNGTGTANLTVGSAGSGNSFGGNANYVGAISGAVNLTVATGGDQILGSNSSSFTGTVTANGAVRVTGTNALGAAGAGNDTTVAATGSIDFRNVAYAANEILTVNGGTVAATTGTSSFNGPITLGTSAANLVVSGTQLTLGGVIDGAQGVTQSGPGTLALAGANTYTGPTSVTAGTLRLTGSLTSSVTVADGATLSGTGTIAAGKTLTANGTVAPGTSPGTLTVGDVSFGGTGTFAVELNGTTAGTQYDQLVVVGSVSLAGALNVILGYSPAAGDTFVILDNDGMDPVSGKFAGLPEGKTFMAGGQTFRISYVGGSGNDVTLTVIDAANPTFTGTGGGDVFVVSKNGANTEVRQAGNLIFTGTPTTITVNGMGGNDTLTVDYTGGTPIPAGGISYNGGGQAGTPGDTLVITGGSATLITHVFTNANDGSVTIDGATISYTGLEPITDNMSAADRVFTFNGGTESITLSDTNGADGKSTIDSTLGESVEFVSPTNSLTINAGTGDDTVLIASLDATLTAAVTVNTDAGADLVSVLKTIGTLAINTGSEADAVFIGTDAVTGNPGKLTPIAGAVTVDGGADGTALTVDGSGVSALADYEITDTTVTRSTPAGFGGVTYSNATSLLLTVGDGDNVVTVTKTAAGTPTTVKTNLGADTVNVLSTNVTGPLSIETGGGADKVFVGTANVTGNPGKLTPVAGAVTVDGGAEGTSLVVDGSGVSALADYEITATTVTRSTPPGFGGVTYSNATSLLLTVGDGDNVVTVTSTAAGTPTTVLTNLGADTVNVLSTANTLAVDTGLGADKVFVGTANVTGNLGKLTPVAGAVTVDGGTDGAALTVDGSGVSALADYEITDTTVTRSTPAGFGGVTYANATSLLLTVGGGDNVVTVTKTAAGTPTTVLTNDGVDTVNVLSTANTLAVDTGLGADKVFVGTANATGNPGKLTPVAGAVTVDGGADGAALTVDGSGVSALADYEITDTTVTRSTPAGFGGVTYANATSLLLTVGDGDNVVTVTKTAAGTPTTVKTNGGADTVNVLSTANTLAIDTGLGADKVFVGTANATGNPGKLTPVAGAVTVDGGTDGTALTVDGSGVNALANYAITDTTVTRSTPAGFGGVTYSNATSLLLTVGDGDNIVDVNSTAAGTPTTVLTNGGLDTVNVLSTNATGPLIIDTGAGLDSVFIGTANEPGTPGKLTPVAGAVTVDGGAEGADLVVDGSGVNATANYEISATTVTRSTPAGFGGVTYSNATSLLLTVGDGNNVVTVTSTAAGTPTTVETNAGDDSITVLGAASALTVDAGDGSDTLTLDFGSGNPIPADGLTYIGGGPTGSDTLALTNGSATLIVYAFANENDGTVTVDGQLVTYTGLEPITDNLDADARQFDFNGGSETITITDTAGGTTIDSTAGESVEFTSPTVSLTINAGSGDDTVNFVSVDATLVNTLTVNGDGGVDTVNLNADITFALDKSLTVAADNVTVGAGTDLAVSGAGAITFTADTLAVDATATLTAAGTVSITTEDPARVIDLGTEVNGRLSITDDELDQITAGLLVIGDTAQTGGIEVTAAGVGPDTTPTVHLKTAGTVTQNGGSLVVTSLAINAGGLVDLDTNPNAVGTLAANTTAGDLLFDNGTNKLAVGTVNGLVGVVAANIELTADDMDLTQQVKAAGGDVTLTTFTPGVAIDLGTDSAGKLGLTDAELNKVTATRLFIGDATQTAGIEVSANVSVTAPATLFLTTLGAVTDPAGKTLTAGQLGISAGTGVGTMAAPLVTAVGALAASTTTGGVFVSNTGDLTVDSVVAVVGVSAPAGDVQVATTGTLTVDNPITAGGSVTLVADDMAITAAVTATTFATLTTSTAGRPIDLGTDAAGTLGLTDAELDLVTAPVQLNIGSAASGKIDVTAAVDPANATVLNLTTGGAVTDGGGKLIETNLAITAQTGIGTTAAPLQTQAMTIAALVNSTAAGADIAITNAGATTVGTVAGVAGVQRLTPTAGMGSGTVVLLANSPLTVNDPVVNAVGGDITLTAGAADSADVADVLTLNANVTATGGNGSITLNGNTLGVNTSAVSAVGTGGVTANFNGAGGSAAFNTGASVATADGDIAVTTKGALTVAGDATVTATGTGDVTLASTERNVLIDTGTAVSTNTGDLKVTAAGTAAGSYNGVLVAGAVSTTGGDLTITGNGGNVGTGNVGVLVSGTVTGGGAGTLTTLTGTGGSGGAMMADAFQIGVAVNGATAAVATTGGDLKVEGTGGGSDPGNANVGVQVSGGGTLSAGGTGTVVVTGKGGDGAGNFNQGVLVQGTGSAISSAGGAVSVNGTGDGTGNFSHGVAVDAGTISAGGTANLSVAGTGAVNSPNSDGVTLFAGASLTAAGGSVDVTGTADGTGTGTGIRLNTGSSVSTADQPITLTADTMQIDGTVNAGTTTGSVTLQPESAGVTINLGSEVAGSLSLTDAELDNVTAKTLNLGNATAGLVTVSQPITRAAATDVNVTGTGISFTDGQLVSAGGSVVLDARTGAVLSGTQPVDVNTLGGMNTGTLVVLADAGIGQSVLNPFAFRVPSTVKALRTDTSGGTGSQFLAGGTGNRILLLAPGLISGTVPNQGEVHLVSGTFVTDDGNPTPPAANIPGMVFLDGGTLAGDGMTGTVTDNNTGLVISPGDDQADNTGVLMTGAMTLTPSTRIVVDLVANGTTPGDTHDQIQSSGSVDLGNARLDIILRYDPAVNTDSWVILTAAGALTGELVLQETGEALPEGKLFYLTDFLGNLRLLRISYLNNQVTLFALDIANPIIDGDIGGVAAADLFVITRNPGNGFMDVFRRDLMGNLVLIYTSRLDGMGNPVSPAANGTLTINGLGGNDVLLVDYTGASVPGGTVGNALLHNVVFEGGTQADTFRVVGSGTETGVLTLDTPSAMGLDPNSGTFAAGGKSVTFESLAPIDMEGLAVATVTFSSGGIFAQLAAGTTTLGASAVVVSPFGPTMFETVALRNNAVVNIDTSKFAGADIITVAGSDPAANHLNQTFNFTLRNGAAEADELNFTGNFEAGADLTANAKTITVAAGKTVTAGDDLSFDNLGYAGTNPLAIAGTVLATDGVTIEATGDLTLSGGAVAKSVAGAVALKAGGSLLAGSAAFIQAGTTVAMFIDTDNTGGAEAKLVGTLDIIAPGGAKLTGGTMADKFTVGKYTANLLVDGGDPVAPAAPGDVLVVDAQTVNPLSQVAVDKFSLNGGTSTVQFTNIETVQLQNTDTVTVDLSAAASDDKLVLETDPTGTAMTNPNFGKPSYVLTVDGATAPRVILPAGLTTFNFNAGDAKVGEDQLIVRMKGGEGLPAAVNYTTSNGANANAALAVLGSTIVGGAGAGQTALVKLNPVAGNLGSGTVQINGGKTIAFSGLKPVDLGGLAAVTVNFNGADDAVTLAAGTDFTQGGATPAITVSGTTGGLAFETLALFQNTNVTIDTSTTAGVEAIAVTGTPAGHANTNLTLATTTQAGSQVVVSGSTAVDGNFAAGSFDVTVLADLTAGGNLSLTAANTVAITGPVAATVGNVTLTAGTDLNVGGPVSAGGDLTATAGKNLTTAALVGTLTAGGAVTATAGMALTVNADVAGGGNVTLSTGPDTAANGDQPVTVAPGVLVASAAGTVTISAADDLTLNNVLLTAAAGGVVLKADTGGAVDTSGATIDLLGASFQVGAGQKVSVVGNADADTVLADAGYDVPVDVDAAGGADTLRVAGTTVSVSGVSVTSPGKATVTYANAETVALDGAGLAGQAATDVTVLGDDPRPATSPRADDFRLSKTAAEFQILANGQLITAPALNTVNFLGGQLDDALRLTYTAAGAPFPAGGVAFDGGTGTNDVLVVGTGGQTVTVAADATTPNAGLLTTGEGKLTFANTRAVDLTKFQSATIRPAGAADTLTVADGVGFLVPTKQALVVSGTTGGTAATKVAVWNTGSLTLDTTAADGDDTVTVASGVSGHNVTDFTVLTGTGTDLVQVTGAATFAGAVTVTSKFVNVGSGVALTAGKNLTVSAAGGSIANQGTLASTGGDIGLTTTGGVASKTITANGSVTIGGAALFLGNGDALFSPSSVTATTGGINVTVATDIVAKTATLTAAGPIVAKFGQASGGSAADLRFATINTPAGATVTGGSGADRFFVTGYTSVVNLDGGDPTAAPGDTLLFDAEGLALTAGPASFATRGQPVNYVNMETVLVENSTGALTVNGSDGDDRLTLRGPAFTYQFAGRPQVTLAKTPSSFRFNGLGGADTLVVDVNSLASAFPANGLLFDGGTGADVGLCVLGANNDALVVASPAGPAGLSGAVILDGTKSIGFANLEGTSRIDVTAMKTVTVAFDYTDVTAAVDNNGDVTAGNVNQALVVSDTGPARFVPVGLWNNGSVILRTDLKAGNDNLMVRSANNAHGNANLTIETGTGTDSVTVNGAVAVAGDLTIGGAGAAVAVTGPAMAGQNVTVNAGRQITVVGTAMSGTTGDITLISPTVVVQGGATLTAGRDVRVVEGTAFQLGAATVTATNGVFAQTGGGGTALTGGVATITAKAGISFQNTIDGPGGLALNTPATTTLTAAVGGTTPVGLLVTDAGGTTVVNGGTVRTGSTGAFFNDPVQVGQSTAFLSNGGALVFASSLNPGVAPPPVLDLIVGGDSLRATSVTFGGDVGTSGGGAFGNISVPNVQNLTLANGVKLNAVRLTQPGGGGTTLFGAGSAVTLTSQLPVVNFAPLNPDGTSNLTTGGALNLVTDFIRLDGTITAAGAPVVLQANTAGVTQGTGGKIVSPQFFLAGKGTFDLNQPGNDATSPVSLDPFAAAATPGGLFIGLASGKVLFRDANDLGLGTAPGTGKAGVVIANGGGDVTLTVGGNFAASTLTAAAKGQVNPVLDPVFDLGAAGTLQAFVGVGRPPRSATAITFVTEGKAKLVSLGFPDETQSAALPTDNPLRNVANDTFTVRPIAGSPLNLFGDFPIRASGDPFAPFDQLVPQFDGISNTQLTGEGEGNGTFTYPGSPFQRLRFRSIEGLGNRQFQAFAVQTSPRTADPNGAGFAVRLSAQLAALQAGGGNAGSTNIGAPIQGSGGVSNPFVVSPNLVNPGAPFGNPNLRFADVDGDQNPELIIASGSNVAPVVTVVDGRVIGLSQGNPIDLSALTPNQILAQFLAYEETFVGGVSLAAADLDGDGKAEIVTGAGNSGGQRVRVFELNANPAFGQTGQTKLTASEYGSVDRDPARAGFQTGFWGGGKLANFFAFGDDRVFRGGVNVAAGDVTGDGTPDLVLGAGVTGAPRIQVLDGATGAEVRNFFAFDDLSLRGGVFVDAGQFDGDAFADIAAAPAGGGAARVRVLNGAALATGQATDGSGAAFPPINPDGTVNARVVNFGTGFGGVRADFFAFDPRATASLVGSDQPFNGVGGVAFGASTTGTGAQRELLIGSPRGLTAQVRRVVLNDLVNGTNGSDIIGTIIDPNLPGQAVQPTQPITGRIPDPNNPANNLIDPATGLPAAETLQPGVLRDGVSVAGFAAGSPSKNLTGTDPNRS